MVKNKFLWKRPIDLADDQEIKALLQSYQPTSEQKSSIEPGLIDELLKNKTLIGKGEVFTTYKVNNSFSHKGNLCLKIMNEELHNQINIEKVNQLFHEIELINSFNHPNIIKLYGVYNGDKNHYPAILMEYCKYNLMKDIKDFSDSDLVGMIYEICAAMSFVHQKKIIHCDLKINNILINRKKHVKISDFGISKIIDLTTFKSKIQEDQTLHFMAPEIFNSNEKIDEKIDVYSFGVIMYFILTKGEYPEFTGIGDYESLELPNSINKLATNIIKCCWSSSPGNRPNFDQILKLIVDNNFMLMDGIERKVSKIKEHLGLC